MLYPLRQTRLAPKVLCMPSYIMKKAVYVIFVAVGCFSGIGFCQQPADPVNAVPASGSKHIFGIIPNFRTSPTLAHYAPITPSQKFKIAQQDSFDRGTFLLAAAFAGESQLKNSNRSFGQGVEGYSHYLATGYADFL